MTQVSFVQSIWNHFDNKSCLQETDELDVTFRGIQCVLWLTDSIISPLGQMNSAPASSA